MLTSRVKDGADPLEVYLSTLPPMMRTNARKTLGMTVRLNGQEFLARHVIVERRVREGARVTFRGNNRVLLGTNGAWFDSRNITVTGINYAAFLTSEPQMCSICRQEHGLEIEHACE